MSENLDLVRSIYAKWGRGDFSRIDWADPQLVMMTPDGPETGRWVGLRAVGERWGQYLSTWDDLRAEAEEFRELDGERVLVLVQNHGRGRTSGVTLAQMAGRTASLFRLRDGKVVELILYWDRDRA